MKKVKPKVVLIVNTPKPEYIIETALLQCRENVENFVEKRAKRRLAERIKEVFLNGHLGILEHASATFQITGVSRAFSHQLVRHRIASYAQMSQRAVPVEKMGYIVPPSVERFANDIFTDWIQKSEQVYNNIVATGVPMEDARFVLPNAIETQIVVVMNFRSWIHFLKLRLDKNAQWEIRYVAEEIWRELKKIAPNVFSEEMVKYWE